MSWGFLTQTNNKMKVFSDLSINYRLRTIQRTKGLKAQTIYCRIILKGNRFDISTKQMVSLVFWDKLTEKVKQKYNLKSLSQLPEISRFDPVALLIEMRPGQICKIERSSITSVDSEYYRVCV